MERLPKIRLLDRVRQSIRLKNYACAIEKAYVYWIRRFIIIHGKKHPETLGKSDTEAFLSHLAVEKK